MNIISMCHYLYMIIYTVNILLNWFLGIDFKIKTVELQGKKIKLQIW